LSRAPAFGRNRREDLAPSDVCAVWRSQPCEAELDEEILEISCVTFAQARNQYE